MNAITPAATMGTLLTWPLVHSLAEPDARPASVLVDELDAARIKRRVNLSYRIASSA
jgi:hypothetical protein